jgi:hypothetical protein
MIACLHGKVTFALGRQQKLGQSLLVQAQHLQVDQLVDIAPTLLRTLLLVHRRGARALDAGADQAGKQGGAARPGQRR